MDILVACEESQAVTIQLRKLGHTAFSCDLQDCSGGYPEWHIKKDVLKIAYEQQWDMMIGFPPCTDLAVSGAAWFKEKIKDGRQKASIDFFIKLVNVPINKIAIENPIGIMSKMYRKPDQIIHPYYFGDPETKSTCLWLKNLPILKHYSSNTTQQKRTWVKPEYIITKKGTKYSPTHYMGGGKGKERSKTYLGIAKAMAEQWTIPFTPHPTLF